VRSRQAAYGEKTAISLRRRVDVGTLLEPEERLEALVTPVSPSGTQSGKPERAHHEVVDRPGSERGCPEGAPDARRRLGAEGRKVELPSATRRAAPIR